VPIKANFIATVGETQRLLPSDKEKRIKRKHQESTT